MDQFQIDQLNAKLEECLLTGQTYISWAQIYAWYRVDRIAKAPWRDIQARWQEMCEAQRLSQTIELQVRGTGGKALVGGVRLVREHIEHIDGTNLMLSDLTS